MSKPSQNKLRPREAPLQAPVKPGSSLHRLLELAAAEDLTVDQSLENTESAVAGEKDLTVSQRSSKRRRS